MEDIVALEYYDISESELEKIQDFCNTYLRDYKYNIMDMYLLGVQKPLKIDKQIEELVNKKVLKIDRTFKNIINNFAVVDIYNIVPNIKEVFKSININFAKSAVKAKQLKNMVIDHEAIFYDYFKDYGLVSLTKYGEKLVEKFEDYEEYIEDYIKRCTWLPDNYGHKTYNMQARKTEEVKPKNPQELKEEIKNRIKEIRQTRQIENLDITKYKTCKYCGAKLPINNTTCPNCHNGKVKRLNYSNDLVNSNTKPKNNMNNYDKLDFWVFGIGIFLVFVFIWIIAKIF